MKQRIKNILRPPYQFVRYVALRFIAHRQFKAIKLNDGLNIERVTSLSTSFFGYYNVSPENKKGQILFVHP